VTARDNITFVFAADPQPSRADEPHGASDQNDRVLSLAAMNLMFEALPGMLWPSGCGALTGTRVGQPGCLVFGGDMCQTGGDYSSTDQFFGTPATYQGGWELAMVRHLFNGGPTPHTRSNARRCPIAPVYFGLGNHDLQTADHPAVGWLFGMKWSEPQDFWRFQMWNFIAQSHSGHQFGQLPGYLPPRYPVTAIDAQPDTHGNWKRWSYNYCVDLGPVDLFQLHVCAGDQTDGREGGLLWLRHQLSIRGPHRPIVIVQHFPFWGGDFGSYFDHWRAERDNVLAILQDYNIVAALSGHFHEVSVSPKTIQLPNGKSLSNFTPGSCGDHGVFGLFNVSADRVVYAYGGPQGLDNGGERSLSTLARPLADGLYRIGTKYNPALVLSVSEGGTDPENGRRLTVVNATGTPEQTWRLTHLGNRSYRLTPLNVSPHHWHSMSMDADNGGGQGAKVQVWDSHESSNQAWLIEELNGHYRIAPSYDHGLVLDVVQSGGQGANVTVWTDHGGDNQRFAFQRV
jgi:Calcineurin-like phosphoesterase/Ricin-type beta-trefoil lectin domain